MCGRIYQGIPEDEQIAVDVQALVVPDPGEEEAEQQYMQQQQQLHQQIQQQQQPQQHGQQQQEQQQPPVDRAVAEEELRFEKNHDRIVPRYKRPLFNTAPGRQVPVIIYNPETKRRELKHAVWGLVYESGYPGLVRATNRLEIFYRMYNARDDNLANIHRTLIGSKRCVVVAQGFFEWHHTTEMGKKKKIPYFVSDRASRDMYFGAIYEQFMVDRPEEEGGGKRVFRSCSIITTHPSRNTRWLHDRNPLLLRKEELDVWLDPTLGYNSVAKLIVPREDNTLQWWPVTEKLGHLGYQGDDVIQRVDLLKGSSTITSFFKRANGEGGTSTTTTTSSSSSTSSPSKPGGALPTVDGASQSSVASSPETKKEDGIHRAFVSPKKAANDAPSTTTSSASPSTSTTGSPTKKRTRIDDFFQKSPRKPTPKKEDESKGNKQDDDEVEVID